MTRLYSKHGKCLNDVFKLQKNTEELPSSESPGPSTSAPKLGRPKKDFVDLNDRSKPRIIADEGNNSSIAH